MSSSRKRVLNGAVTLGIVRFAQLATPLIQMPVFIHGWGFNIYGGWITANALAAFPTLASVSIMPAVTAEMAMRFGRGDRTSVADIFATGERVIALLSCVLLAIAGAAFIGATDFLGYTTGLDKLTVLFLFASTAISSSTTFLCGALGSIGRYSLGNMIEAVRRTLELVILSVMVLSMKCSPMAAAVMLTLTAVVSVLCARIALSRTGPEGIYHGRFRGDQLWLMSHSICGAFCLSFGYTQLMVLGPRAIIGIIFGNAAVVQYTVASNLMKAVRQAADICTYPFQNDLSFSFGRDDYSQVRRFFSLITSMSSWVGSGLAILVVLCSPIIVPILTSGKVEPDMPLTILLCLSTALECISLGAVIFLIAIGRTLPSSIILLISGTLSLAFAAYAASLWGLAAFGVSNLVVMTIYATVVFRIALRMMQGSWEEAVRAFLSPPFKQFIGLARHLLNR